MKKFLLSLVLATRLFTAFDPTDTRHEFIAKVRSDFAADITSRIQQLDTQYEAVALLDIARERLGDKTTDWSSVINLVSCGWGYAKGVDTSLKATAKDLASMRRSISSRALQLRYRGYVDPIKDDDVFTLQRSSGIANHIKAINQASLGEYHVPSKMAVDLVGPNPTKVNPASADFKSQQLNLKYEGGKWSFTATDGSWDQVIWKQGPFNLYEFRGSMDDAKGSHLFRFSVRGSTVLIRAISTGYMVNVEGYGIAVKVADGDKLGVIESSAYPSATQKNTIRIKGASYRGGRAVLYAPRGSISVATNTISTSVGLWSTYETRTQNGGEYQFYSKQEQIIEAGEDISLDGNSVDVSFTTLKSGKDLFLGERNGMFLRLINPDNSVLHTHGTVLSVSNNLIINTNKWDGRTLSKYVGSYTNKGNGWTGQDLVATCDQMGIYVLGNFIYHANILAFHDDAERIRLAVNGYHKTFETTPLQALTAPPRQQAPQQPQMSKKDMMRALGMGGFGNFFGGGHLGSGGSGGFLAIPSMPCVSGAMMGAPTVQSMDFNVGTRDGNFSMSLTSTFKDNRGSYVNTSHPTELYAPDRMHIVAPTVRSAMLMYKVYKASKRLKGAKRVIDAASSAARVPTGGNDEDPESEDEEHRVLSEKDPNFVHNAGGHVKQFVTDKTETYYRVYSDNPVGGFVTKVKPKCSAIAREGLSLPPSNTAKFVQEVVVPAGTRLQRSRALPVKDYGTRGGMEQFEILQGQNIPSTNFSKGVPLP